MPDPEVPPGPPPSPKRRGGRPTKRDADREDKILGFIRSGVPKEAAALASGIGKSTFFEWCRTIPEFQEAVTRATAESEAILVARVAKASSEDWRAAMELLRVRFPETYGRRDYLEHGGRVGVDVTLDRLREIREKAEARKRGARS